MKKATVTIAFDDEKLGALEFSLRKEHSSMQEHLEEALNALYEKSGAARLSCQAAPVSPQWE